MSLLDVRTQVVKDSGRYDLIVGSSYTDNGMDHFINSAIKMLDRMIEIPQTKARLFFTLASSEYSIIFDHNCRAIYSVWINDETTRYELLKVSLSELKEKYKSSVNITSVGKPGWFAIAQLRALKTAEKNSLATFIDLTLNETDEIYSSRGIVIVPPAETTYTVEINGLFKTVILTNDADECYWTEQEDDLLIRATLYKLEARSRGTENAKNFLSAIRDDVRLIDYDVVDEESYDINQLRG